MATFPTPKVHRTSRRKLGRGQFPPVPSATVTPTVSTTTVTLTYSIPVIANAMPPITVTGVTNLSFAQTSPTVVTITLSATGATAAWVYEGGSQSVVTKQGGQVAPASGTF